MTATSVVIDLTYATPGAACGPTQRLAAPVLPDGRWGMLLNAGDPACPVGTLPLAFAQRGLSLERDGFAFKGSELGRDFSATRLLQIGRAHV